MTGVETVARIRVGGGTHIQWLACHPRLPLVAGLDSARPAVHVWDCGAGGPRELGTVAGADSTGYEGPLAYEQKDRTPAVAWHPHRPLLLVSHEDGAVRWTPDGVSTLDGPAATAVYQGLTFSPDGGTVWASPSATVPENPWEFCDAIDLASGAVGTSQGGDTGITAHPAGGLVVTYRSDQGATLAMFARVQDGTPAALRMLRRALILNVDGYESPVFGPDGRHFAIRGNAYGATLDVFEFPSLTRVLTTTLGEPNPGFPYPDEWFEGMRAWSRYNIAFGARPGVLWVGTPTGTLVEIELDSGRAVEHDLPGEPRVTAMVATPSGELVVADRAGGLSLVSVDAGTAPIDMAASRHGVTQFLNSTDDARRLRDGRAVPDRRGADLGTGGPARGDHCGRDGPRLAAEARILEQPARLVTGHVPGALAGFTAPARTARTRPLAAGRGGRPPTYRAAPCR